MRDRASELRDGVLQLYRQIENQSQEFQSQLLDLKEMLAAIPTVKATDSDIPQLHNVLDLFEQHRVKVDRRHYEMSSMVSPAREATNTLRKAVGDACEGDSSAGY